MKIPPGFVTDFGITRSDEAQISFFDASNDQALERCNFTVQRTNNKIFFSMFLPTKAELRNLNSYVAISRFILRKGDVNGE